MSETPYFDEYQKQKNLNDNTFTIDPSFIKNLRLKKQFSRDINGNTYIKDVNLEYKSPTGWSKVLTIISDNG